MKKFLISMAVVFGALTLVFYINSIKELDSNTAKILGTNSVVNIQATVFCAACAILCALNTVGAIILSYLEKNNTTAQYTNGQKTAWNQASDQITTYPAEQEAQPDTSYSVDAFLSEMESANSVKDIQGIWGKYKLNIQYSYVEDYIKNYSKREEKHGTPDNFAEIKKTIRELLT